MDAILEQSKNLKINHMRLKVWRSTEKERPDLTFLSEAEISKAVEKVSFKDVKLHLLEFKDPEEQMEALMKKLELTNSDIETRNGIAHHIQVQKQ